jgi:DNA-binding transcriptional MerR regulator
MTEATNPGTAGEPAGGLLAIGAFSRASSLSVKTLRAYHEAGILVPDRVDARTGYRAYSPAQLTDAAVIVRLRALDVPLDQVRIVLRARDPELTRRVLADHRDVMAERLVETERIVAELQSGMAAVTLTPVHVRYDEPAHTVRMSRTVPDDELWGWLDWAFEELDDVLGAAGTRAVGPRSALYLPELTEEGSELVEAFLPVTGPPPDVRGRGDASVGEVPGAWVAVLVHAGPLDEIGDTYRALGAWVGTHAEPSGERIRERYLVGGAHTADASAHRTEIAWPIVEAPDPAP